MIRITISGMPTGRKALLYEFPGRKGRRTFVPTYRASAHCISNDERFEFAVTRDSSLHIFGRSSQDPFEGDGECPPCGENPYMGTIREDGATGFRIQLYEPEFGGTDTLIGTGTVPRKCVQIHFGAAASQGCILVAGRRRLYRPRFENPIRSMLAHTQDITVIVEPRTRGDG